MPSALDDLLQPGGALRGPLWEMGSPAADPLLGESLGHWRVEDVIGAGGMAVVYRVSRSDGAFEQTAAMKVMLAASQHRELGRRFARERQTLAKLQHGNIARLLDGGALPDGRPYFVMELVEGERLDRYCDARQLSLRARLRLFLQLLDGVEHAHQQLVIHQDIKPSNVLVSASGELKLLDFGICELLEAIPESDLTQLTVTQTRMMTPQYATPEQLGGGAVSVASDIYQLGLVLYRLLTGVEAQPLNAMDLVQLKDIVLDTLPPPPSQAAADPNIASRDLRGDLDNIVMQMLRKEPARRYRSVDAVARDIDAYLTHRPVAASPESRRYRIAKFLRRHRLPAAVGAAALAALVVVSAFYVAGVKEARDLAAEQAFRAESTVEFLFQLLEDAGPDRAEHADMTARELIDQGADRLRLAFANDDDLLESVAARFAWLYLLRSEHRMGIDLLESATVDAQMGPYNRQLAGYLYYRDGELQKGRELLESAVGEYRRLGAAEPATLGDALANLALVERRAGNLEKSESLMREALSLEEGASASSPSRLRALAGRYNNLALILFSKREYEEAIAVLQRAIQIYSDLFGPDHRRVALSMTNLSHFQRQSGDLENALESALASAAILAGDSFTSPEEYANVSAALGNAMRELGRYAEAREHVQRMMDLSADRLGPDHYMTGFSYVTLGTLTQLEGDCATAIGHFQRGLDILRAALGDEHRSIGQTQARIQECLSASQTPEGKTSS